MPQPWEKIPLEYLEASLLRLEPRSRTSEEAGYQACIADPLWMLARQWQNGEFTAENAGSPISVAVEYATYALNQVQVGNRQPVEFLVNDLQPQKDDKPLPLPLEVLVEQESREIDLKTSVRIGQKFEALIKKKLGAIGYVVINDFQKAFPLAGRLTPINGENIDEESKRFRQFLNGKVVNGAALLDWKKHTLPQSRYKINGKDLSKEIVDALNDVLKDLDKYCAEKHIAQTPGPSPAWASQEPQPLLYQFKIGGIGKNGQTEIGDKYLSAPDYQNGDLDWYHFNAAEAIKNANWVTQPLFKSLPTHLRLRGTSLRWWEFEDAKLDFPHSDTANPTDLAKSLVVGYELFYSDDWYTLSLPVELSNLLKINSMKVINVFGEEADIYPAQVLHPNPLMRWEVFGMSSIAVNAAISPSVHEFDNVQYAQLLAQRDDIQQKLKKPGLKPEERFALGLAYEIVKKSLEELQQQLHHSILFIPPAAGFREESAPLEEIRFLRDEGANLVWAVEHTLLNDMGNPISGFDWHRDYNERAKAQKTAQLRMDIAQLQTQLQRPVLTTVLKTELAKKLGAAQEQLAELENTAPTPEVPKYRLKTDVPGNWIPFLPVRQKDGTSMELRKGTVQDENNAGSHLLRYLTAVEESSIPRSGRRLMLTAQRLRWTDGSTYTWIGRKVAVGKGEGSSGLKFDIVK